VAWIPAWILCCNMIPSLHVFAFFLQLFYCLHLLSVFFSGISSTIAMEWIPPFLFPCILLCVSRCVYERERSLCGIRAVGVGSRDIPALPNPGE
jgi:hypothetical protein